ncbi:hypothetical protein B566_EDAN000983 [Ephemera danica]|nr:hypothetical protein B566_EDAN000983 [Ephemera danica]
MGVNETVLNYLKEQNRPYNANDITQNLHKQYGRTAIQKALDYLVAKGKVREQKYGKQKVYAIKREGKFNRQEFQARQEALKAKHATLEAQNNEHTALLKKMENQLKDLKGSMRNKTAISLRNEVAARKPARINVYSTVAEKSSPVLVVVRQQKGVLSWQLPYEYKNVSRTLCPVSYYYKAMKPAFTSLGGISQSNSLAVAHEEVIVSLSSASLSNVDFSLSASVQEDFLVGLSEERTTQVSASQPRYFMFEFPANFDGLWQTMTQKGGITLTRDHFPAGFFVVFVVKGDDSVCLGETVAQPIPEHRQKTIRFSFREKISYDEYLVATFGAFGAFLFLYLAAFIIAVLHHLKHRRSEPPCVPMLVVEGEQFMSPTQEECYRNFNLLWRKVFAGEQVYVSDMSRSGCPNLRKGSQMYLWNLLTVATFYALPVVQLVITYQRVLNNTGNQDLCFYNFLCSHPVGVLSDFNHVYSNIGYAMLGLLFTLLYYGLPQQFGLFYAMGAALIAEGILSACYHVCPNYTNFQFDSSFMYVIAMMCMLRIYQNRHPDIHASAYTTFAALAAIIFIGMTGVLTGTLAFWITFTILRAEKDKLQTRYEQLSNNAKLMTEADKKKIVDEQASLEKEWRKRRRMALDLLDAILENYPKSKQTLYEEIGVETDEEAGVKVPPAY